MDHMFPSRLLNSQFGKKYLRVKTIHYLRDGHTEKDAKFKIKMLIAIPTQFIGICLRELTLKCPGHHK